MDDGSPDNCPQICDEYTEKNNIFKVIHKKNAGLASARNAGLDIVQGKWVTFIDSDDMVTMDYIDSIFEMLEKWSLVDCVLFGTMIENVKVKKRHFYDTPSFYGDIKGWIRIAEKKGVLNYSWNKIYKREIIEQYSIRFREGKEPGEDLVFNCEYLERCKTGAMSEKILYVYYKQCEAEASLSHKCWSDLNEKTELFIDNRCQMYKRIGLCLLEDEIELAKQNLYYIYKCIPNMYKQGKCFEKKKRITFYKKIIGDERVKHWIAISPNKESVIKIFNLLYRTRSPFICDITYSLLFGIRNFISEIRSKQWERNKVE